MEKKVKKVRQYRSNQGRDPRKMRGSYIIMAFSLLALLLITLGLGLKNYFFG
jgi:hypothetical protein